MPLLARLRHLFDLDAEPAVVDAHLGDGGLAALVERRPGLRIPGAFDGLEIAVRELLRGPGQSGDSGSDLAGRLADSLGEPLDTGVPALTRLAPGAARIAAAGAPLLIDLGVPERRSGAIVTVARAVAAGRLRLEPGADVPSTLRALTEITGIGERTAMAIVMRAVHWPDAFPSADPALRVHAVDLRQGAGPAASLHPDSPVR
jgi:AraC family transcriptional regulator of adaptative response / DNA-3-methyladenine glycosylase II